MFCSTGAQSTTSNQGIHNFDCIVDAADKMTVKSSTPKKSTYRHIPHSEKPPHLVARRNARERKRVQAVNNAFLKLRKHVPFEHKQKRLSKVKTLQSAIDYIANLQNMIDDYDREMENSGCYNNRVVQYQQHYPGETVQSVHYMWTNGNNHKQHLTENNQPVIVWPEYGTLGMNEITSLPDV